MTQVAAEQALVHPALFYQGPWEYLAGTVPLIREGLAEDEPVAVAVPGPRLRLLRGELGDDAARVRWVDMTEAGRNPGRIIVEVLGEAADPHPNRHVRIIGEPIWPDRSDVEYPACVQHEALINLAFRGRDVTILCPYDIAGLDPVVVEDAVATHPTLIQGGRTWASPDFAPERIVADYNRALPCPPEAMVVAFDASGLDETCVFVVEHARRAGLEAEQVDDVVRAVGELLANSVRHGGGSGVLRAWTEPDHVVYEATDTGRIDDPLVGRRASPGQGLLAVNRLADLVRMHTRPDGTTVRVYFRR